MEMEALLLAVEEGAKLTIKRVDASYSTYQASLTWYADNVKYSLYQFGLTPSLALLHLSYYFATKCEGSLLSAQALAKKGS